MEITLYAANDTEFTLDVDFDVFGSYRPAKIHGDPDSCYEAEYPEVEFREEARLLLKNGKWIDYDLRKLSQKHRDRILKIGFDRAMEGPPEPDYEPDDEPYDD